MRSEPEASRVDSAGPPGLTAGPGSARGLSRGAAIGSIVTGVFGIAWGLWGASGLTSVVSAVVRVVVIVLGVMILAGASRLRRQAQPESQSMFRSRSYLITVAVEVILIVAGASVLSATGRSEYVSPWIAAVVGIHFLAFGYFFFPFYYGLGTLVLAGALAGAVVGLTGHGRPAITATTGLITAAALLGAGAWRVFPQFAHGGLRR